MDSDKSELTFAHTAFRLGTLSGSIFRWYHPALPLSGESLLRHLQYFGTTKYGTCDASTREIPRRRSLACFRITKVPSYFPLAHRRRTRD